MKLSSSTILFYVASIICCRTNTAFQSVPSFRNRKSQTVSSSSSALHSSIYTTSEQSRKKRTINAWNINDVSSLTSKKESSAQTTGVTTPTGSKTYFPPKKLAKSRADLERLNAVSVATAGTYIPSSDTASIYDSKTALSNLMEQWKPIMTTSLLITGNTIGAGTLVMPEVAAGPGMAVSTAVFTVAFIMNLISGLAIAEVAIKQYENSQSQVPSSFKEFAQTNLESESVANGIAVISMFVNACVLAFNLGHLGELFTPTHEVMFAGGLVMMGMTMSSTKLGNVASMAVTGLFITLAALMLPGFASISHPADVFWAPGVASLSDSSTSSLLESAGQAAPIILTSMVYQNIVPSVTKILNYDRTKTAWTLALGSFFPMMIYELYSFVVLGGGCSSETTSPLLMAAFSITTIVGSSIACVMSIAEELESCTQTIFSSSQHQQQQEEPSSSTVVVSSTPAALQEEQATDDVFAMSEFASSSSPQQQQDVNDDTKKEVLFSVPSILLSVGVPLAVGLALGNGDDLTASLRLAGSYGSPMLYGAIPALMAWKQRESLSKQQFQDVLPGGTATLAMLAAGSAVFMMEELSKDIMSGMTSILG